MYVCMSIFTYIYTFVIVTIILVIMHTHTYMSLYIYVYIYTYAFMHIAVSAPGSAYKVVYMIYTHMRAWICGWTRQHRSFVKHLVTLAPEEVYTDLVMRCNHSPTQFLHFERYLHYMYNNQNKEFQFLNEMKMAKKGVYPYIHTYIHSYIHTCIHTYIHIYIHIYIYIHILVRSYTHTHTHTYLYIYIYIYVHIHARSSKK